ncbi:N-acetylmuramoyl-L-alanine amidase [Clostridium sp.]|uniref:N-acetylmuramoyl-L-alanine amidase family protein n=1 Tax=Clostridium sp. TaxID=1506 RepID=UPI003217F755
MANYIVCLDAGHGGSDPGASYGNLIEKNIVLVAALTCRNVLTEHGVQVIMTRNTDVYVGLSQRAAIANNAKANYFVSIHCNAGGGDRGEVINSIYRGKGLELSNKIASEMKAIGQDTVKQYDKKGDGGTDYYAVIRETNMDAVIVECAFLDNTTDNQIIDTVAEQEAFGVAIAKGILKQLGMTTEASKPTPEPVPTPTPTPSKKKIDSFIKVDGYSWVKNLDDFAGVFGVPVKNFYAYPSEGEILFRVSPVNRDYYSWVQNYKSSNGVYDFAGNGVAIDRVQMKLRGLNGYSIRYRVHILNGGWLDWVVNDSDYAGLIGKTIDAIEVEII